MDGLEAIFRWLHIFAGITWIGHLYFFNWVNGPFQAKIDGPTKKPLIPSSCRERFTGSAGEPLIRGSQAFCLSGWSTTWDSRHSPLMPHGRPARSS